MNLSGQIRRIIVLGIYTIGISLVCNYGFASITLDGSFIEIDDSVASRSLAQWGNELALMRTIGMNTVITQIARYDSTVYYPSTTTGVSQSGNQPLEKILTVADTTGMTVYLGLYYDDSWWSNETNVTYLTTLTIKTKSVIDELWSLYSSHPSWKGWYISTEPDN